MKPTLPTPRPLSYAFPLREGVTVELGNIPRDLKLVDVARIERFLKTLTKMGPVQKQKPKRKGTR